MNNNTMQPSLVGVLEAIEAISGTRLSLEFDGGLSDEQAIAVALVSAGFKLAQKSNLRVTCSVDISTDESDSDARCFGEFTGINSLPSSLGFGSREIQMLFEGSLNN